MRMPRAENNILDSKSEILAASLGGAGADVRDDGKSAALGNLDALSAIQLGANATANEEVFSLLLYERDDGLRTRILQKLDLALRNQDLNCSKILSVS